MPVRNRSKLTRFFVFVPYVLAAAVVFLVGYYLLVESGFFAIAEVAVSGAHTFVSETDLSALVNQRVRGQNIFLLKSAELENVLLTNFQGAKGVAVAKVLPKRIVVNVVERTPLAVIYSSGWSNGYLVDDVGYVLGIVDPKKTLIPKIDYNGERSETLETDGTHEGDVRVGYFLDEKLVRTYVVILKAIDREKLHATSMLIGKDELILGISGSVDVVLATNKDIDASVSTLSLLLKQLAADGRKPKRIDLRYDKVVVLF